MSHYPRGYRRAIENLVKRNGRHPALIPPVNGNGAAKIADYFGLALEIVRWDVQQEEERHQRYFAQVNELAAACFTYLGHKGPLVKSFIAKIAADCGVRHRQVRQDVGQAIQALTEIEAKKHKIDFGGFA